MKALVMQAPWVLTVEEVSTPEPGPDDVLVKIAATGICGSDFHGFSADGASPVRSWATRRWATLRRWEATLSTW